MANQSEKVKIKELFHTCPACPSQWEGKTVDGGYIYVRYRWGRLTIGVAKSFPAAVWETNIVNTQIGDSLDGMLPYEELIELTKDEVEWPSADKVPESVGGVYKNQFEETEGEETSVQGEG